MLEGSLQMRKHRPTASSTPVRPYRNDSQQPSDDVLRSQQPATQTPLGGW